MQQLASLAQLKAWVPKLSSEADDVLLNQLLVRVSGLIMSNLSRTDVGVRTVTETVNGKGTSTIFLREWPVVSLSSCAINGNSVSAAANFSGPGYTLTPWDGVLPGSPQLLSLNGSLFTRGAGNATISYRAGYLATEDCTIAGAEVTVAQSNGPWCSDQGVTYASGGAALQRTNNNAPAVGQYKLDTTTDGKYIFNAADNGADIVIAYGFVPGPLNQACVEIVAERYRYRQRIGQTSVSLDGKETMQFDTAAVTKFVAMNLQPYKRVIL